MNGLSSNAQAFAEQVFRVGSWRAELPPRTSFSLESGAIALGMTGKGLDEDLAARLIHAAPDPNPESLLQRANLVRERLFEPPRPVIPDWLEDRAPAARRIG